MRLSKKMAVAFILIGCVSAFSQSPKEKLKIGTYIATGSANVTDDRFGVSQNFNSIKIKITIKSVGEEGKVKAEVNIDGRKGILSGEINSKDELQLEGGLVKGEAVSDAKLSALVVAKDNSLRKGKFALKEGIFRITGEFTLAVLKEEED